MAGGSGSVGHTDMADDDPNNLLLEIGEIRLTEGPNANGDDDAPEEVDDEGNVIQRDGGDRDNEEDEGDDDDGGEDGAGGQ